MIIYGGQELARLEKKFVKSRWRLRCLPKIAEETERLLHHEKEQTLRQVHVS